MRHLLAFSLMIFFLVIGTSAQAQTPCNIEKCPPACKKVCEKICGSAGAAKTTALKVENPKSAEAKAKCQTPCQKTTTAQKEEGTTNFVQALLVSQKVESESKTTPQKCTAADQKRACCSRKKE